MWGLSTLTVAGMAIYFNIKRTRHTQGKNKYKFYKGRNLESYTFILNLPINSDIEFKSSSRLARRIEFDNLEKDRLKILLDIYLNLKPIKNANFEDFKLEKLLLPIYSETGEMFSLNLRESKMIVRNKEIQFRCDCKTIGYSSKQKREEFVNEFHNKFIPILEQFKKDIENIN